MTTCSHVSALPAIVLASDYDSGERSHNFKYEPSQNPDDYKIEAGDVLYQQCNQATTKLPSSIKDYIQVARNPLDYIHVVFGVARDTLPNAYKCVNTSQIPACGILQVTRTGVVGSRL